MPRADQQRAAEEKRLLDAYVTYDEHVDVVSSFEWIFTERSQAGMSTTVAHFERYPKITNADGKDLTPDFTVLFTDRTAIIGEIAQFALPDESVDSLCSQLAQYAEITHVPDGSGSSTQARHVDVMYLVPMRLGNTAYGRIIEDRYLDADHEFHPQRPPCIVQYAREESGYTLQRLRAEHNGTLFAGDRQPDIQTWLDRDFKPSLRAVTRFKISRPFINDPIPPLYLAMFLWTKVWPSQYGVASKDIRVTPEEAAEYLRERYGHARVKDVKRALELLDKAGLAADQRDGSWLVSRSRLNTKNGERDVARIIAGRAVGRQRRVVPRAAPKGPSPVQDPLF